MHGENIQQINHDEISIKLVLINITMVKLGFNLIQQLW